MDVLSKEQRRNLMQRIRQRDTCPEITVRRLLFAAGMRYRLSTTQLRYRPDLIFVGPKVALFVHGCFWHGHGCALFRWPRSNAAFWKEKIHRNMARDERVSQSLVEAGWRCLTIWECGVRGRERIVPDELVGRVRAFLAAHGLPRAEIPEHSVPRD